MVKPAVKSSNNKRSALPNAVVLFALMVYLIWHQSSSTSRQTEQIKDQRRGESSAVRTSAPSSTVRTPAPSAAVRTPAPSAAVRTEAPSAAVVVQDKNNQEASSALPINEGPGPCPPPDPNVEQNFKDFPQKLQFGKFYEEKGKPFITQDFWADIVDNRRTFFLRPQENGMPSKERMIEWIRSRPHPIALVMNNQHDYSWPKDPANETDQYEYILNETNIHAVYAGNARDIPKYPKLQPVPIGLKWSFKKPFLFAEPKDERAETFQTFGASSPAESEALFHLPNRTSTVYWRPMIKRSNARTTNYVRDTPALITVRKDIPDIVKEPAKNSMVWSGDYTSIGEFYQELKNHRFVISPPGNGLDTHTTWEALLNGCIPIVPRSALDRVFDDLPVWLVDSWEEVTDAAVKEKEEYFLSKAGTYNWDMIYRPYWEERIHEGLCTV